MKKLTRIFAMLLAVMMVVAIVPATAANATAEPNPWTEERTLVSTDAQAARAKIEALKAEMAALDTSANVVPKKAYNAVDALFEELDAMNDTAATKSLSAEMFTEKVVAKVTASATYKADSVEVNGEVVTWWTTDGIHCMYNPRMDRIADQFTGTETIDEIVNEPSKLVKGGQPSSKEVYLIGPYYGIDSNFTDQYKNEASRIAKAIGDTDGYTLYSGRAATVDKVAEAVSNGAVVLYDSHGATDYESGDDLVTGANYSYLCLNSEDGITYDDYLDGCLYGGGQAFVNGQVIANHMTKNSPGGISWFATCLSMATNTLANPLRSKGVEVVYGYSQSVTFIGEYCFEEAFWDAFLVQGTSVKKAIASMKSECGNWDLAVPMVVNMGYAASEGYATISEARNAYQAFPIVVSDEDSHPGQRSGSSWGACSLQTVNSTYTLGSLPNNGNGEISNPPTFSGSYHSNVIDFVDANGGYDSSQGVYWTGWQMESTNYYYTYYLNDDSGVIWMESLIQPKSGNGYGVHAGVYLTEGEDTFDISTDVLYYSSGNLVDSCNKGGYDDRADFTKSTSYIVSGSSSYISSSYFQSWFNDGLQDLMLEHDSYLYSNLGFGLKCLGFVNYEGMGPDPVAPGDFNNDGSVTNDDVIALMWHVLFPSDNPITGDGDLNNDGSVTNADVTILMWHVLFPEDNPLNWGPR